MIELNILEKYLVSMVIIWITAHIIKYILKTERPKESNLKTPGFPSAHTACAVTTVIFLDGWMLILGIIGAFAVAVSRVYFKHHTILDVLAGCALGTGLGVVLKCLL